MNKICFIRFGQSLGSSKHISNSCLLNHTEFQVDRGTIREVSSAGGRKLKIEYYFDGYKQSFEITRLQRGGSYHSSLSLLLSKS